MYGKVTPTVRDAAIVGRFYEPATPEEWAFHDRLLRQLRFGETLVRADLPFYLQKERGRG